MSLPPGSTSIPGWTTRGAELAWVSNANSFGARTPFGVFFLELTGYHDHLPYAGVEQTIATTSGRRYRLSLAIGSNAEYPGAGGRKQLRVSCGETTMVFTFDPLGTVANEWNTVGFTFQAASPATHIAIAGLDASGIHLAVDQVSVVAEPAELKILAVWRSRDELRLRFLAAAGRSYLLESRSNLARDTWQPMPGTETPGADDTLEIVLPNPFTEPQRFYRLRARGITSTARPQPRPPEIKTPR